MVNRFVDSEDVVLFEEPSLDGNFYGIGDTVLQDGVWYVVRDVIVQRDEQRIKIEPEREPGDDAEKEKSSRVE